jgi:hypothetical protein
MKTLIASLVIATSLTGAAHANNYSINTSNSSACSQTESSGRSVEFTSEFDSRSQNATIGIAYRIELGKKKLPKIDCNRLFNIEVAKQQLELDKARMELELLKAQIEATKQSMINGEPAPAPLTTGDDW